VIEYLKTRLESDLYNLIQNADTVRTALGNAQNFLKGSKIGKALQNMTVAKDFLKYVQGFFDKYDKFLESIDQKSGADFKQFSNSAKKIITEMITDLDSICAFISKEKIDPAGSMLNESLQKVVTLESELGKIAALPHIIDLSKLAHEDWRRIGIAGVHYRSRVFLSYPFRDKNQTKDENQKFIDYLIKPLLNLFNIEPITARSHLVSQENIEENTIALVADCDGIIGFFTVGDTIENVEHELANNENIIAVCKEEGANSPSMRRSRLQLEFTRNEPSQLLLQIAKALKDKEMFKLVV